MARTRRASDTYRLDCFAPCHMLAAGCESETAAAAALKLLPLLLLGG